VKLEKHARAVLTDSGTVQEECAIFRIRNVTVRDVTERPETIECGSNALTGADPGGIVLSLRVALGSANEWFPPAGYTAKDVSATAVKIVLGYLSVRRHVS
jgi:UDP-N-acetylglucosamine 2-epimerase (non-hydrolysing)